MDQTEPISDYKKGMCKWCGQSPLPKRRSVYCSDTCSKKYGRWLWEHTVWRGIRHRIVKRDHYRCTRCGYSPAEHRKKIAKEKERFYLGKTANKKKLDELTKTLMALEVHHILPRALGGGDEEENLITLCAKCHDLPEYHRDIKKMRKHRGK